MRARLTYFLIVFQSILFLAHGFLYMTLTAFFGTPARGEAWKLQVPFILLSVSFVAATLLAHQSAHILVRAFYTVSAVWLGLLCFCVLAACACWILHGLVALFSLRLERPVLAMICFGAAILAGLSGLVNGAWLRVKRVTVQLPHLPDSWRGRTAALVSDMHLGHVRGFRFARRIVTDLVRLQPDIVFIAGDMYDGSTAEPWHLAEPWSQLSTVLGKYFIAGNHEGFSDHRKYFDAVRRAGIHVLDDEKLVINSLQIIGVHQGDSTSPQRFRAILRKAGVDRGTASILLTHAPNQLRIAEEEGISLLLCGHTHGGQFFPFTWITSRVWGKYVYGLHHWGQMAVYTSCGVGTWGPPMRLGTRPEIVLIRFE